MPMTRGHLNDCLLMLELPHDWICNADRASMLEDHEELLEKSVSLKTQYNGNYTVLDAMVNNKNYQDFIRVITWIQDSMVRD